MDHPSSCSPFSKETAGQAAAADDRHHHQQYHQANHNPNKFDYAKIIQVRWSQIDKKVQLS